MIAAKGRARGVWLGATLLAAGTASLVLVLHATVDEAPLNATPSRLTASPERFQGDLVRATGILRVFSEGSQAEHFVIEGNGQSRVGLREIPPQVLRPLIGAHVVVEGIFGFAEDFGFFISIRRIERLRGVS